MGSPLHSLFLVFDKYVLTTRSKSQVQSLARHQKEKVQITFLHKHL
jgi:hypothetical protein